VTDARAGTDADVGAVRAGTDADSEAGSAGGDDDSAAGGPADRNGRAESAGQDYGRRQFLGLVGGTAAGAGAAGIGLTGTARAAETRVVSMRNNVFDPVGLYVDPGTTVRFEIASGAHSATAYEQRVPADADHFDSGVIADGGFEYTFEEPGTYDYYCSPHKAGGMVGRIVVGSPGGPAEDTPIPDGEVPDSETIVEEGTVTDGDGGGRGGHGGMMSGGSGLMGGGSGMLSGGRSAWLRVLPLGLFAAVTALVGGAVYRDSRTVTDGDTPESDATATLRRRYERGEIDAGEFAERQQRLLADRREDEP
jgi:plastocyanin/uncharacterized membrane protein